MFNSTALDYLPSEVRVRMRPIQIEGYGKVDFCGTLYHTPELKVFSLPRLYLPDNLGRYMGSI